MKGRWKNPKKELPPDSGVFLCILQANIEFGLEEHDRMFQLCAFFEDGEKSYFHHRFPFYEAVAWMELPQMPPLYKTMKWKHQEIESY